MIKQVINMPGPIDDTIVIACTDVVQQFTNVQLQNVRGNYPLACLITVEGNNIRFCHGSNPTQGADGSGALGHTLYAGQSYLIENPANIRTFSFINQAVGLNAYIQVSMAYSIGD